MHARQVSGGRSGRGRLERACGRASRCERFSPRYMLETMQRARALHPPLGREGALRMLELEEGRPRARGGVPLEVRHRAAGRAPAGRYRWARARARHRAREPAISKITTSPPRQNSPEVPVPIPIPLQWPRGQESRPFF